MKKDKLGNDINSIFGIPVLKDNMGFEFNNCGSLRSKG